jgi:hypothetical protein
VKSAAIVHLSLCSVIHVDGATTVIVAQACEHQLPRITSDSPQELHGFATLLRERQPRLLSVEEISSSVNLSGLDELFGFNSFAESKVYLDASGTVH